MDDHEHPGTSYVDDLGLPEPDGDQTYVFQIGDPVRISHPESQYDGEVGRVVRIEDGSYDIELRTNGQRVRMHGKFVQPETLPTDWHTGAVMAPEESRYQIDDIVMTKLGPANVKGTGLSPLGRVYRVCLIGGTEDFDVWEHDLGEAPQGSHMMMAAAPEWSHGDPPEVEAWRYILEHQGGTFDPTSLQIIEAEHGFGTGMRIEGDPNSEVEVPAANFTSDAVRSYWQQYGPVAAAHDYKLGSWLNAGIYYMDVSQWYADRIEAINAAIDFVQLAIWDCAASDELLVLTPDRRQVLPEIVQELTAAGQAPELVQQRLDDALLRWSDHLPS